jgi:putative ABC transport system permease protein
MPSVFGDLRYAARRLVATPGFTAVAVATLVLGIGATTAVFSIVDTVLFQRLPYPAGNRLVRVYTVGRDGQQRPMSWLDFRDYRAQSRSISTMSLIDPETRNLTGSSTDGVGSATPLRLRAARVNADFFDLLKVPLLIGTGFSTDADQPGHAETAVLSEGLWRSRFGADPGIVGRSIVLDGAPVEVVGVAPRAVITPTGTDLWLAAVPSPDDLDPTNRGAHYLAGLGRLAPGATVQGADRELRTIAARLAAQYPGTDAEFSAGAGALRDLMVRNVRPALEMLLVCVACLLLIACANVANLLLIRAAARESEMAVRTALGAGAWRLVRQLVTESVLLAFTGSALGMVLAAWIVSLVKAAGPPGLPRLEQVHVDFRLLVFAAVLAVVTGVAFGLVPAWHAVRTDVADALKRGGRDGGDRRASQRMRSALAIAEMALAVVLLIGAGLLTHSLIRLMRVDPGFRADHLVTMSVSLPGKKYPWDRQQRAFGDALVAAMHRVPGVEGAAVALGRPLDPIGMRLTFRRDDQPPPPPGHPDVTDMRMVSPEFFRTLGIRLLDGRTFSAADRPGAPLAFVVSQTFVNRYFPNEPAVGKHLTFGWTRDTSGSGQQVATSGAIVGIVADVRQDGPAVDPVPAVYVDFEQIPVGALSLLVRSSADSRQVMNAAVGAIRALDSDLPVFQVQTMDVAMAASTAEPRFYTILLGSFGAIALVLAGLGLYGVIAYGVSQRRRELGIRIALGAGEGRVVRLVLRQGAVLAAIGVVIGLTAAVAASRLLASLLFGVTATDPVTFAVVPVVLGAVALLAVWLPARRAARVDPIVAIRAE